METRSETSQTIKGLEERGFKRDLILKIRILLKQMIGMRFGCGGRI